MWPRLGEMQQRPACTRSPRPCMNVRAGPQDDPDCFGPVARPSDPSLLGVEVEGAAGRRLPRDLRRPRERDLWPLPSPRRPTVSPGGLPPCPHRAHSAAPQRRTRRLSPADRPRAALPALLFDVALVSLLFEQRRGVRQEGWHLPGQLLQDRIGILSHLGIIQRADQVLDPVVEVSELGPVPRFFSPSLATVPSASSRVPPACAACLRRTVPGVCPRPVGGGPDHPDTARSRRNLAALTAELDNGP
jgi:hypothetical protein